jgi:hypothetical protein
MLIYWAKPHYEEKQRNFIKFNWPDHDQHTAPMVKPEAATAVVELLMMGVRTHETCWAVHKHQVINFRDCCI